MNRHIFNEHVTPYDRAAALRAAEYDRVDPDTIHRPLLPYLRRGIGLVKALDIGAGSGRDAAWLAGRGYHVVAIEPAPGLRRFIREKSGKTRKGRIDVRDGMLPSLATLKKGETFDLITLGAVWQHVAPRSRKECFNRIAAHLKPGGIVYISLREGPPPPDRKMYDTDLSETRRLARLVGLNILPLETDTPEDALGRKAVRWTAFAARKPL